MLELAGNFRSFIFLSFFMTAETFRSLVRNFTSLSKEETDALRAQTADAPYCQVSHMLVARSSKDHGSPDQKERLTRAAVYSTDRAVLKWVMTAPVQAGVGVAPATAKALRETSRLREGYGGQAGTVTVETTSDQESLAEQSPVNVPAQPPKETPAPVVMPKKPEPVASTPPPVVAPTTVAKPAVTLEGEALRADLAKELSKLQKLKHEFEESYEKFTPSATPTNTPSPESPKKVKPSSIGQVTFSPGEPVEGEPLIEAIKTSKKKPKLVTPKVAEQGEIIDNFIKVAPTLPRAKPTQPAVDLSEDSVHHGDNIVSETLVNILLKQGKKDKAIEMLKKLIWKFPQKKTYFAAQIEALKG
jgi:hypothetical protein